MPRGRRLWFCKPSAKAHRRFESCRGLVPTSDMINYTLSDNEILELDEMALSRRNPKRQGGVKDMLVDNTKDALLLDKVGIRGEYVVHKILDWPFIHEQLLHGDGGVYDMILPQNHTISIKTPTSRHRNWLLGLASKYSGELQTNGGILVWPADDKQYVSFDVVGWFTKDDWNKNRQVINLGYGDTFLYSHSKLRDINTLIKWINKYRIKS